MLIITRYFTKEFFKTFILCMTAFVMLYLLVDLFDRLDDMIKHQVSLLLIIRYVLCSVPMILYQVCPLGVLLSTFITIGIFVRHQEITALKAQGISLYRVLRVFILIACCLCGFCLWLQEYVLPLTNRYMKQIKTVHIKGKTDFHLFQTKNFWYRSGKTIVNIDFFEPGRNMLHKITIYTMGDGFRLVKRVDALRAVWADGAWIMENGTVRQFGPGSTMTVNTFQKKRGGLYKNPDEFRLSRKEGDEMSIAEIREVIQRIRREGYSSVAYEADLHAKISYPFISVIMAILGIPFALRIGRSGGMAMGIAVSIVLGFTYWTFFAFCLSLGKGGVLPPFAAAWVANAAFGFLGLYMFLNVRQ